MVLLTLAALAAGAAGAGVTWSRWCSDLLDLCRQGPMEPLSGVARNHLDGR